MKYDHVLFPILFLSLTFFTGCGYTQKTVLPKDIKTIHVETVKNKIPINRLYAYQPGIEMMLTNSIVHRLEQDGNLKVVNRKDADAILETYLVRFEQEGLRFNSLERVEEYRLFAVVSARLVDGKTGDTLWEESNFNGDAEYFVSGVRSIAREEAAIRVSDKLASNLVDRIVEDW